MKKTLLFCLILSAIFVFAGCATGGKRVIKSDCHEIGALQDGTKIHDCDSVTGYKF